MANRIYVIPLPGKLVRDPVSRRVIGPDGQEVDDNIFIRRRIADGDLVIVDDPLPPAA
jgi:hypothetical protein